MIDTIDVEYDGETVEVPRELERSDVSTWYGDVSFPIRVDRVLVYDGVLRVVDLSGDVVVEAGLFDDAGHSLTNAEGWIADEVDADPSDATHIPGETLWANPLEADRKNGVYLLEATAGHEGYLVESASHAIPVDTVRLNGNYLAFNGRIEFECDGYEFLENDSGTERVFDIRVESDD